MPLSAAQLQQQLDALPPASAVASVATVTPTELSSSGAPMNLSNLPSPAVLNDSSFQEEEIVEEEEEETTLLLASGEYQIVGIRYYRGVAHPGEYVHLVREPSNPYDRNAIRIDNMRNEKIGHIKRQTALMLAPIMDNFPEIKLEGTIPRRGNQFTLPIFLEFYGTSQDPTRLLYLSTEIKKRLKYNVNLAPAFQRRATTTSIAPQQVQAPPVVVQTKMDWTKQQKELDQMFDKQLEQQLLNLPDIGMPPTLKDITLFEYQQQGIKWLVRNETNPRPIPFYKRVQEQGRQAYLCEITNSSQPSLPDPIKGSILCDAMGLGKSIQTLGLILSAPPSGVKYQVPQPSNGEDPADVLPPLSAVEVATTATLKQILKQAKLKVSGKKGDLVQRVKDGMASQQIKGEYFPNSMFPSTASSGASSARCTLIVCPVSVMSNWTQQVQDHVHEGVLNLELYHGPNRHELLNQVKAGQVDILLASYHTLAADFAASFQSSEDGPARKKTKRESIFDVLFHRIVLDEAHTIRNSNAKFFKAVSKIQSDRKLALTGTPFINRSEDVYSLLAFLGMAPLNNKQIFTRAISQPLKAGNELGLARIRTAMGFVSLRRSKQSVNIKMVEKIVNLSSVEFQDDAHKQVYEALFGTLRVAMKAILSSDKENALSNYSCIFEKLLRLRQSCCSGLLVSPERRQIALDMWKEICNNKENRLTPEEGLKLLEQLKGQFTQELPECGICLEEFEQTQGTILKSCKHVFCKPCINQVLSKSNQKCPYCRQPFTKPDIVDLSTASSAANQKSCCPVEIDTANFGTPAKIQALLHAISQTMKSDEKAVIFSQFTSYLDIIGEKMKEAGHSFVRIDGSVSATKRIECIQRFNRDDGPRFILCSLLASGTGINLTRGNHAFLMDCWWNEAMESQAMDRIHRINQTRTVHVTKFVMKGSIEERIVKLQQAKSMQAKGVLQKLTGNEKRKALLGDLRGLLELEDNKDDE